MGNSVKKVAPSSGSPGSSKKVMSDSTRNSSNNSTGFQQRLASNENNPLYLRRCEDLKDRDSAVNWEWSKDGTLPRRKQISENGVNNGVKFPTVGAKAGSRIAGKPPLKAASDNSLEKQQRPRAEKPQRPRVVKEEWHPKFLENDVPELLEASCTMHTFTRRPKLVHQESSEAEVKQQSLRNVNSDRWQSRQNLSSSGACSKQSFLNQSGKNRRESAVSSAHGSGTGSSQETQDTASSTKPRSMDRILSLKQKGQERDWTQVLPDESRRISDYYIDFGKELGRGNFGVVSVWQSKVSGEKVACKSISKSRFRHRKDVEEIRKEILILQRLKGHPHICQLREVFEDAEKIHLVMELCPGKALSHQILRRKRLTESEAVHIFRQIVESVRWVHTMGVMHRDLKPENILLSAPTDPLKPTSVHVKLADFGLSVFLKEDELTSGLAGSPYYFAPEVVSGGKYGREADVWSLGVVLYVLLSGMLPFYGETDKDIFNHIKEGKVVFHSKHWKGVSTEGRNLVLSLLTRDPRKRPTAAQVLEDGWFRLFS